MSLQRIKNIAHLKHFVQHPDIFLLKLSKKISAITDDFYIDKAKRRYIKHNKKVWGGWVDRKSEKVILMDWHSLPVWNVPGLFFANVLARKRNARICAFSSKAWFWAWATHAIYRSLNIYEHITTGRLSHAQRFKRDKIYDDAVKHLKTKEDVFHLKVNGYHLGMDIYETYLKEFNRPTVVLDQCLFAVVRQAIGLLVFWEEYFDKNQVAGVVISHDCYIEYNVPCRMAYKRGIAVYLPTGYFVSSMRKQHDARGYFYHYRNWFAALSEGEKKQALAIAKDQVDRRFSGEITAEMRRIGIQDGESPFHSDRARVRVIRPSEKIKVLISSHCFFDNPHAYGGMIFVDFYEWLKFLARVAEQTDYDWYLKTHPNPLPRTIETIQGILGDSKRITILPSETSHHQMVQEGINFVLTVYGTVGHEYPAMGVRVINAGYNPHVAYGFTITPKSFLEYEKLLLDLENVKNEIRMDEIYEFYYMHYYYCFVDDLVYRSFKENVLHLNVSDQVRSNVYAHYLDGWSEGLQQRCVQRIEAFIDSGKAQLFSKGPVDVHLSHPAGAAYLS